MESTKYIGMDVHKDAISIAVLNSSGKLVMESIIETKAITILEFVHGRDMATIRDKPGHLKTLLIDLLNAHLNASFIFNHLDPMRLVQTSPL